MWTKEEKEICLLIWGAIPINVEWAKKILMFVKTLKLRL